MASKIRVRVGDVEVEYEGPEAFLENKLPGLLAQLSDVAHGAPAKARGDKGTKKDRATTSNKRGTLASFLKTSGATTVQNKKFLATVEWLHLGGQTRVRTGDVTKALRDAHQSKLGNASQCLSNNVSQGFCEKHGNEFYVTDEGRDSLK